MRGHRVRLVQAASSHIPGKPHARSAVTNGAVLLADVDGRSTWARRARDLINEHLGDIGGLDQTSAAERSLVRRASVIEVELERLETKFALANQASADDLDLYVRASGNLRRLLEALGLQRRAKNITPTPDLQTYLRRKAKATDIEDAEVIQ